MLVSLFDNPNVLMIPMHHQFDLALIKTTTLEFHFLRDSLVLSLIGGQALTGTELYLLI